jgi:WD40 repeat protein
VRRRNDARSAIGPTTQAAGQGSGPDIKLWDVTTGQHTATLKGHTLTVASVAFCPDGKTLASGSADRTIQLWDVTTGKNTATLQGHSDFIYSVVFSPDGKTLASGAFDGAIKLWGMPATRKATR